jgi:hypothetical protein
MGRVLELSAGDVIDVWRCVGGGVGNAASFRKPIKGVKRKLKRHCDDWFILSLPGRAASPFSGLESCFINHVSKHGASVV